MDVNEFRTEILEEIHLNATMNGTSPREEFLAMYTAALIDAEEFEDFEQVPYEGVGSQNRRIQIDGYSYNELDDCLDIAVCPFRDSTEPESLTATEADTWFRRARAFVENAQSGFLQKMDGAFFAGSPRGGAGHGKICGDISLRTGPNVRRCSRQGLSVRKACKCLAVP